MTDERATDADSASPVEYSRETEFIWKFFLLLFGVIVTVTVVLSQLTTFGTSNILESINIVVNILLTGALIILYRDLSMIQDRQVQAMKASYTPLVGILEWEMTEEAFEQDSAATSERLVLTLSNEGNSMARDLRVLFAISYETTGRDPQIRSEEVPIRRVEGQSWWHSDMGGSLPEGAIEVDFYTTPSFRYVESEPAEDGMIRFNKVVELLSTADVEQAQVAVSLRYRNAAGEESEIDFAVYEFELQRVQNRGSRLKYARPGRLSDAENIKANAKDPQ